MMKQIAAILLLGFSVTAGAAAPPADQPLMSLPYSPGLNIENMDTAVDACTDFYQYSCGGWIKKNPIPSDQSAWSVYGKLADDNQHFLWGVLSSLAAQGGPHTPPQRQIGDYFAACLDQATVDRLGATPLQNDLRSIDGMRSLRELPALVSQLQLSSNNPGPFFNFGSNQDFADSQQVIAFADAGGLGLPERDYYTKTDDKSIVLRKQYQAHVARMFGLVGDSPQEAQREAVAVMRMETALAKASLTIVQRRNPRSLFHKMKLQELQTLTPDFDWGAYLHASGISAVTEFNVAEPKFYQALSLLLRTASLADVKVYLRWHLLHATAAQLASPFVEENFDFFGRVLQGVPQLQPRWKRCVKQIDADLGESLGREFVERAFTPEIKQKTLQMTLQIEEAMRADLEQLTWMSANTRQNALAKLHGIVNKIGYPDKWRDYSSVRVTRDDYFGNVERAAMFESRRQLAKIGKPLDRSEWTMTAPTVDAEYNEQLNDVNFPAGVLQPPLFDLKMDDAPNYGNTGGTIGHELTHAFDDEGRQYDARGNLRDWWTAPDAAKFTRQVQCVSDQYSKYTIIDDVKINGKLTRGEDVADLGGLVLAWMAWRAETVMSPAKPRDHLTPEQRFFVGYAQWACESTRPEKMRLQAVTDPHSPGRYRVNGVVVNMPEFARAFSCKAGQPMVNPKPCRVW